LKFRTFRIFKIATVTFLKKLLQLLKNLNIASIKISTKIIQKQLQITRTVLRLDGFSLSPDIPSWLRTAAMSFVLIPQLLATFFSQRL